MAAKKSTDVMIAGKVYTLSGYEEEGYLQHVASYINTKISEITEREEFRRIPNDMKSILIQLNIADDFFKAKNQYEEAEENYKKAEKDLFELKHELVDTQMKVEELLDKLNRERQERNQKSDRESQLEENYKKLEEKYQLLLNNAKVADERNRQFEEMLRLTQQEKREIEAVNKELRLNKEKLETTLADALLGTASPAAGRQAADNHSQENQTAESKIQPAEAVQTEEEQDKTDSGDEETQHTETDVSKEPETDSGQEEQALSAEDFEGFLTPAELSKEEVNELRETINETMTELSLEEETAANSLLQESKPAEKDSSEDSKQHKEEPLPQEDIPDSSLSAQDEQLNKAYLTEVPESADTEHAPENNRSEEGDSSDKDDSASEDGPQKHDVSDLSKDSRSFEEDPAQDLLVTSRNAIPLTPGLSEEELTELLGPIKEPQPVMAELSKEELEELLAPAVRHEITDEGPVPEPDPEDDEDDDFVPSVMSEVSEDDDPEIKALARQIAELERQEQAEKIKKKSKKNKKRKR